MEYQVSDHDTLERIAACHDCTVGEIVKLNKMHSRMVFPGQRIRVPVPQDPTTANPSTTSLNSQTTSDGYTLISAASPPQSPTGNPIKPPGSAVRQTSTISYQSTTSPHRQSSVTSGQGHIDAEDTDCLRRFLKVKVKQVTESDGTVTGTLLITPNCVMFDPDLVHPLVKENGPDLYGMVANMDDIVSVSVFKHDHSLVDKRESETSERKKLSFDCGPTEDDYKTAEENSIDMSGEVFTDTETGNENSNHVNPPLSLTMSIDPQLPSIQEEGHVKSTPTPDNPPLNSVDSLDATVTKRRAISDAGVIPNDPATNDSQKQEQNPPNNSSNVPDRPRAHSDLQPSTSLDSEQQQKSGFSRFSPSMTRRSFGRLGRTLSSRANSLKGTVTSGAQTVASGTQKVAHGVVTHTKSAAGHIQSGIETGVKTVAAVPNSIVSVGSEILQEGQDLYGSFVAELKGEAPKSPVAIKREKSLATLESLRQKTHEARMTSISQNNIDSVFTKAAINDEAHDLFPSIESMSTSLNPPVIGTPPDPPYYMTIRVDRKRMTKKKRINYEDALTGNRHASVSSTSDDLSFGNRRRCEFWFAIPRTSADAIYHFLLIWSPGHHQSEEAETATNENNTSRNSLSQEPAAATSNTGIGSKKGLIVLDSHSEDPRITGGGRIDEQNWFGATFGSGLVREWEIITVRELCRRLSLDQEYDLAEIPLPEGSTQSQILDEFMIRQIAEILPPRAEGYPWVLIYNSEKHGFSLATLYRKMEAWYDEMSPILLIIRDTQGHVFGAMVSTAIRPSEHYYGTADACFLFRFTGKVPHTRELRHYEWTGDNQFFINSTRDTLSIGAGQGHSGLWLDADLNHGRSQRCKTFDNEPLAGGDQAHEDFIIQFVEAFGFSMN